MKILHVITGLAGGGAEGALCRLISAGHAQGDQHEVVSLMDRGIHASTLEHMGVPVHCLNMSRGHVSPRGLWRLYRLIRAIRPDIVQTWMYHADLFGGIAARAAGCKTVVWGVRQSNIGRQGNSLQSFLVMKLCAWLSSHIPASIVCCSERAVAPHVAAGYRADKITVIPNGYSLDHYGPDPNSRERLRAELGIDEDTIVLGMVARFDPLKDHGNLFRALDHLKRQGHIYVCVLAGHGMSITNQSLANMVATSDVGDRVRLLGARKDIAAVMNALDIHVLSSESEGFPNVLAEAMACGTPCVSTDVGDAALILGTTGWLVPRKNATRLADAIAEAINEHQLERQIRKTACRRRITDYFDLKRMAQTYRTLWCDTILAASKTRKER